MKQSPGQCPRRPRGETFVIHLCPGGRSHGCGGKTQREGTWEGASARHRARRHLPACRCVTRASSPRHASPDREGTHTKATACKRRRSRPLLKYLWTRSPAEPLAGGTDGKHPSPLTFLALIPDIRPERITLLLQQWGTRIIHCSPQASSLSSMGIARKQGVSNVCGVW